MKISLKIVVLLLIIFLLIPTFCFADDELLEDLEEFEVYEASNLSTEEPTTNAKSIIAIDRKTLSVLYEKNAYSKVPMASTTKIMTCIVALENSSLNDIVTVSKKSASVHGSTLGLITDMQISMNDLLYGLMLRSGNDCAIAIAEKISGSVENFSLLMNQKAKELGLENTNFVTPHGLDDENHYTTPYDLAILTDYALKNEKFKTIVSTKTATISFNGYPRTISNTNELLGNLEGVYGVKTGFTFEAGRCLVSACKRNDLDIIVVVLGADTKKIRTQDSANLINYIFKNFKYVNVSSTINKAFSDYTTYFNKNYFLEKTIDTPILKLEALDNYSFPLETNGTVQLSTKIYTMNKFSSNVSKGTKVGKLYLYNNESLLCEMDITLENQLSKNTWNYYFWYIIRNFSKI